MNLERTVIALGFFDGVHRGHGALLQKTVQRAGELGAIPAVFTFDRPPKEVVTGRPMPLINSPEDRADLARRIYGIQQVILAPFDEAMMTMPWQDFITELLVKRHGAVHLVAGHDYHFGYKNQGDPRLLQEKCRELGIGCDIIPKVEREGITVSSTYIRTLIAQGEMERAMEFLGHPHVLTDRVTHGKKLGTTLGFPTVNLRFPEGVLVPAHGVYVTRVWFGDGSSRPAVTNIGVRPTVDDGDRITVEPWILDFDGDLYGREIRVEYYAKLRGERKFDSLEALSDMVHRNARETRVYFAQMKG